MLDGLDCDLFDIGKHQDVAMPYDTRVKTRLKSKVDGLGHAQLT